jgi:hypothetical protein
VSRISLKAGVQFAHDSVALGRILATLLLLEEPSDLVITSGSDGTHDPNSRHYRGEAVDIRTRTLANPEAVRAKLAAVLGPKFSVINEGDHLHVQVRKGGRYP